LEFVGELLCFGLRGEGGLRGRGEVSGAVGSRFVKDLEDVLESGSPGIAFSERRKVDSEHFAPEPN
jgi:hypothetical protein